jgi:hypothetical protein
VNPGADAARLLAPELDRLAGDLAARILEEDPAYARAADLSDDALVTACRANLSRAIERLGGLPAAGDPLDAARSTGRLRARQAVPLESVLHAYRLGGRVIWDALLRLFPSSRHRALLDVAGAVWTVLDEQSTAMTVAYRDEEQGLLARDRGAQESALSALLDGAAGDPGRAVALARALGLAPGARLVVAVVDGAGGHRSVVDACRDLDVVGTWLVRRGVHVGLLQAGCRTAADLRSALTGRTSGRVALSDDVTRLSDVGHALRTAELAHAAVVEEPNAVVLLEDRLVQALVAAAPDVCAQLVRRWAQPLLELGDEGAELLATVEAVLVCDGSHADAARRLFVHRNTVGYRLTRVERLAGIGLRSNAHRVAWTLTLLAVGRPEAYAAGARNPGS